jgi:hypothetical protein
MLKNQKRGLRSQKRNKIKKGPYGHKNEIKTEKKKKEKKGFLFFFQKKQNTLL